MGLSHKICGRVILIREREIQPGCSDQDPNSPTVQGSWFQLVSRFKAIFCLSSSEMAGGEITLQQSFLGKAPGFPTLGQAAHTGLYPMASQPQRDLPLAFL